MNEYDSTPEDYREWVPAETWQDYDEPNRIAAAIEAEANYSYEVTYDEITPAV